MQPGFFFAINWCAEALLRLALVGNIRRRRRLELGGAYPRLQVGKQIGVPRRVVVDLLGGHRLIIPG